MNTILMAMTFIAFLLTLALRHATQAFVAATLGDGSLARDHRLSLNPRYHISPLGTVVALVSAFPASGGLPIGLGWGKPIRPDAKKMSTGADRGLIIVALSGIASNIVVGLGIAALLGLTSGVRVSFQCLASSGGLLQGCLQTWQPGYVLRLEEFAFVFALVNILIGLLNIIPLFPLDGYHILYALLPDRQALSYRNSENIQELVLLGIFFLLPILLQLSGAPLTLSPFNLLHQLSFNIVSSFSDMRGEIWLSI